MKEICRGKAVWGGRGPTRRMIKKTSSGTLEKKNRFLANNTEILIENTKGGTLGTRGF